MSDAPQIVIPDPELGRQATAALRGYAYQVWSCALAWARLSEEQILLLEVADDYSVASAEALALRQVKDTAASSKATLRSSGVIDAINRVWRFQAANPRHAVSLTYLTTSEIGREKGLRFPDDLPGLEYWRKAAQEGSDLAMLRDTLASLPLDEDLQAWIAQVDDESVRLRLLKRVQWLCAEPGFADLEVLLDEVLEEVCQSWGAGGVPIRDLRDGAVAEVLRRSILSDPAERQLRREDLRVRVAALAAYASGAVRATADPQTIDRIEAFSLQTLAERPEATELLRGALSKGRAWLHGPSGIGKTELSRTIGLGSNRPWFSLDLRDLPPQEASRRLRAARRDLREQGIFGGLILDDLNLVPSGSIKRELLLLAEQVRREDARLLVTAYKPPAPSLIADLGLSPEGVLPAPKFTETETAALVRLAGGDPELWGTAVHIFSGAGFPQLVSARVAGLRARGWPKDELASVIMAVASGDDVEVERESVRQRLLSELPANARSLLYRVSLISGAFDRQLATATAEAAPPIPEPGAALDLLTGPWLEPFAKDRLRVSPLVSTAGSKVLSKNEQQAVHTTIVDALIGRKRFRSDELHLLMMSAFATQHRVGLAKLSIAVMLGALPDDVLSRALFGFPFLRTDQPLFRGDSKFNQMLRLAQLKVAAHGDSPDLLKAIYQRYQGELVKGRTYLPMKTMGVFTFGTTNLPLPVPTWLSAVASLPPDAIRQTESTLGADLSVPVDDLGVFLFVYRSHRLLGLADLEALIAGLRGVPKARRAVLLDGLKSDGQGDARKAVVQSAWLSETKSDTFDARTAADTLERLERRVTKWSDESLAIECVCARVVMLAEYAKSAEEALEVVDTALSRWPGDRRLRRERGKVLLGLKKFGQIAEEAESFLDAAATGDRIDKVYGTRDVAVAAGETGDVETAIRLFQRAAEAANEDTDLSALSGMRLRLEADVAILRWRSGDRAMALEMAKTLMDAAEIRETAGATNEEVRRSLAIMARIFHQDITEPGWSVKDVSVIGIASRTANIDSEMAEPNLLSVWYQLAQLELKLGLDIGLNDELDRRTVRDRLVTFEVIRATDQGWKDIQSRDPTIFVDRLPIFANAGAWLRRRSGENDLAALKSEMFTIVQTLPWEGPLSAGDEDSALFVKGAVALSLALAVGRSETDWLERIQAAAVTDPVLKTILDELPLPGDALDQADTIRTVFWSLFRISEPNPDVRDLFLASAHLLRWLGETFLQDEAAEAICPIIADHWRRVAATQRFYLRAPSVTVQPLVDATIEVTTRHQLAQLVLAAHAATGVTASIEIIRGWRELAGAG